MEEKTQLLLQLIHEMDCKQEAGVKAIQSHMDAGFTTLSEKFNIIQSEIIELKEQKKIQNGRVGKLEKITGINKWAYNHPGKSIIIGILAWWSIGQLFNYVSIIDLFKKLF